jgi:hypothetical protein
MVVTTVCVWFFVQPLKYHGLKENPKNVAAVIGVNFF